MALAGATASDRPKLVPPLPQPQLLTAPIDGTVAVAGMVEVVVAATGAMASVLKSLNPLHRGRK